MLVQMHTLTVRFGTVRALIWFLSGMDAEMFFTGTGSTERFSALRAFVPAAVVMSIHVLADRSSAHQLVTDSAVG